MNDFTKKQERLADLLFTTKIKAKVRRRFQDPDGSYRFEEVVRDTSPVDFAQDNEFALKHHENHPGAPLSPIYVNLRNLPDEVLDLMAEVMVEIPSDEKPDVCTGIPKAGTPIAKAYAKHAGIQDLDIFEKEETAEKRKIVSGETKGEGRRLRIIDDLVTKAGTKLEAVKAAEAMGFSVTDIVVLVDREQGGVKDLAKEGYKLKSVFKLSDLLKYYLRTGRINQTRFDEVNSYLNNK